MAQIDFFYSQTVSRLVNFFVINFFSRIIYIIKLEHSLFFFSNCHQTNIFIIQLFNILRIIYICLDWCSMGLHAANLLSTGFTNLIRIFNNTRKRKYDTTRKIEFLWQLEWWSELNLKLWLLFASIRLYRYCIRLKFICLS